MRAVGAYFDCLIDVRGLKMKWVCEQADVKPGYISRLVSGEIKTSFTHTTRAINRIVQGSWVDVGELLDVDDPAVGRKKALDYAEAQGLITSAQRATFESATPDQLGQASNEMRKRAKGSRGNRRPLRKPADGDPDQNGTQ